MSEPTFASVAADQTSKANEAAEAKRLSQKTDLITRILAVRNDLEKDLVNVIARREALKERKKLLAFSIQSVDSMSGTNLDNATLESILGDLRRIKNTETMTDVAEVINKNLCGEIPGGLHKGGPVTINFADARPKGEPLRKGFLEPSTGPVMFSLSIDDLIRGSRVRRRG